MNAATRRRRYVLRFQEIDHSHVAAVGGKGVHLAELSRLEGISVPCGFCVTTDAFDRMMAEAPSMDEWLSPLTRLKPDDRKAIQALSANIRRTIEASGIPDDVADAISGALAGIAAVAQVMLADAVGEHVAAVQDSAHARPFQ